MADFGWLRVLTPRSRTPQNEEVNLKSEPATPVDAKSPGTGTTAKAATSDSVAIPKLSALPRPAPTSKAALPSKKVESSTGAASSKASTIPKVAAKKAAAVTKGGPSTKDATPKSGSPSGVPASPRKKQEKVKVEKVKPKKGKAKESCKTGASLAPPAIVVHGPENTDNAIDTPRVRSSSSSSDESLSSSPQWGPSAPDASSQAFRSEALAATLDALRSMTMTRRPEDPIPAEYGAHLCRALEAYAALEATARRLAAALAEERQMAKDNRRDFEELADSWIVREARFRAEISRLEKLVVAAQAVQGEDSAGDGATSAKEIITLVRKNSLVRKESVQSDRYLIRLQAVLNRTCETRTELATGDMSMSAAHEYGEMDVEQVLSIAPTNDANGPFFAKENSDIALSQQLRAQAMNSQRERHVTQRHASIPLDCGQKPFGVENQPPARTFKKEPGNIGKRLVTRGMLHDHAKQGYLLDQGRRSEPVASHIGTECTGPPIPANHSGVAIRREGAGGHHDMVPSEPTCSTDATQETSVEAAHKSDGDIVTTDGGRAGRLRCRGNKLRLSYRQRRGWSFEPGEAERLLVVGRSRRSQAHVRPASRTADKDVDEDDAEDELKGPDTTATLSTPIPGRDGDYGDTGVSKQDSTLIQITVIHDPDRQDDSSLAAADEASTAGSCESAAERGACQIPSASLP